MADYSEVLEAAGAKVLDFERFGSYQGTWYACVEYQGRTGFIVGSYGSCADCDGLEASEDDWRQECGYSWERTPEQEQRYKEKLAEFGAGYLLEILDLPAIEARANEEWNSEKAEALAFVERNRPRFNDRTNHER